MQSEDQEDPRIKLMQKWSKELPIGTERSSSRTRSRPGDDDANNDDTRSVGSVASNMSRMSFIGVKKKQAEPVLFSRKAMKLNNTNGKGKGKRKGKGGGGGNSNTANTEHKAAEGTTTEHENKPTSKKFIVGRRNASGGATQDTIEVTKDNSPAKLKESIRILAERNQAAWTSLQKNANAIDTAIPAFTGAWKGHTDRFVKAIGLFLSASSTDDIRATYNNALTEVECARYCNTRYSKLVLSNPDMEQKIANTKLSITEFKKLMEARLISEMSRVTQLLMLKDIDPLTTAEVAAGTTKANKYKAHYGAAATDLGKIDKNLVPDVLVCGACLQYMNAESSGGGTSAHFGEDDLY